jgi:hypothetical protein
MAGVLERLRSILRLQPLLGQLEHRVVAQYGRVLCHEQLAPYVEHYQEWALVQVRVYSLSFF